jgi:hypothetical protein
MKGIQEIKKCNEKNILFVKLFVINKNNVLENSVDNKINILFENSFILLKNNVFVNSVGKQKHMKYVCFC